MKGFGDEGDERDTYEPSPARALNAQSRGVELLLELVERAKLLLDRLCERGALREHAALAALLWRGREVLPEERVVDVSFIAISRGSR